MNSEKFYSLSREQRGRALLEIGEPQILGEDAFLVPSQFNKEAKYRVLKHWHGFTCTCPDFKFHRQDCKHIYCVKYWLELRAYFKKEGLFEAVEEIYKRPSCIYCNSFSVVKNGERKNKGAIKQRFLCKACGKSFIANPEFKGLKADAQIVTCCMDLFFKGVSLRKIQDHVKQFYGIELHHETIRRYINHFMKHINQYIEQFKPEVSREWNTDEMKVKTRQDGWLWAWQALDHETRFLLATNVTKQRYISDARQVLKEAKVIAPLQPARIYTDGLQAYKSALKKEFWTLKNQNTKHIRCASLREKRENNNRVERLHGTMRERLKVMRGNQNQETASQYLENWRTYYNFVRPHQALAGRTPSEEAGIKIPHYKNNKWHSLIRKSINS